MTGYGLRTRFDKRNEGRRVELVYTNDPYTTLRPGDRGTYQMAIINRGLIQHCIKWDNGSNLMLIEGQDKFKFID